MLHQGHNVSFEKGIYKNIKDDSYFRDNAQK